MGRALLCCAAAGLALAPAAQAGWLSREQVEAAVRAPLLATDGAQPDRPSFRFALDDPLVRPRGRPRKDVEDVYWPRYEVTGTARNLDSGGAMDVAFTFDGEVRGFRGPAPDASQPSFPIRAAFYYPWFPENWSQDGTVFTPTLGYYHSGDRSTAVHHLGALRYGRFAAGIYSWWGRGSGTDTRFATHLDVARQTPFRWAAFHEPEGYGTPTVAELRADLHHLTRYFVRPAYLRVAGRPVVFVFEQHGDPCEVAARWSQANDVGAYLVVDAVGPIDRCLVQPDSWHLYAFSPAGSVTLPGYAVTIAPGFRKVGGRDLLPRDLERWQRNVQELVASGAPWQLVISFDEWGEGTAVESAQEWATPSGYGAYLDVLHEH